MLPGKGTGGGIVTWDKAAPGPCLGQGSRAGWAVLRQGLWGSTGGCTSLRWVLCAALQVTLAGYGFAFRYCPGGKHVAWREGSRTPHEGTLEFISLDSHKGAGGSGFVTRAGAVPVVVLPGAGAPHWRCW